jgi:hypothetical protein
MFTMETETRKGWTINIRELSEGFSAILIDANGKMSDEAKINMTCSASAEQYTRKIISWCIKLEVQHYLLDVMLTVRSEMYNGWTINIRESKGGFRAFLVDASGKAFNEVVICMPSVESAEHYAHKVINWSIKLEEQRSLAEEYPPDKVKHSAFR